MRRNIDNLVNREFDLLIIGGGIYGATLAWDAVLRGMKVALIEKGDFAGGTSANSLKIIHGGLRYLQHADFKRMRESIGERRVMMRVAPHLIHPLPCVMPTYGHFIKGPEVLRIALLLNDLFGIDRNRGLVSEQHLPGGKVISRNELLQIVPYLNKNNLTGGAIWYDARMYNSERLLFSFLHGACAEGAEIANYVAAERFILKGDKVIGIDARDMLNDNRMEIRAKVTVNNAGPWINNILDSLNGTRDREKIAFSTALNLVINRKLGDRYAYGISGKKMFKDADAIISKGSRLLFVVPWRHVMLIGTEHKPYYGNAEDYCVREEDIAAFLRDVNDAMPGANIQRDEVTFFYGGLLPMSGVNERTGDVRLIKHFRLIDHEKSEHIKGLISVLSVKYTTARGVAQVTTDFVVNKLRIKAGPSISDKRRIWGGEVDQFEKYMQDQVAQNNGKINANHVRQLVRTYGSNYRQVLRFSDNNGNGLKPSIPDSAILHAQVLFGVREEMALTLADVVLRRTELGTAGPPAEATLDACADIMAKELHWSAERIKDEKEAVRRIYQPA